MSDMESQGGFSTFVPSDQSYDELHNEIDWSNYYTDEFNYMYNYFDMDQIVHLMSKNEDVTSYLKFYTKQFMQIYVAVFHTGINGFLCLLGVVNNILTIIVFAKMGFKETTNITMTAIACWDLLKCLVLLAGRASILLYVFEFPEHLTVAFEAISTVALDTALHIVVHTSNMLAAYVAVERCLCVSMPFTVKFLLTRKTAIVASSATSVVVFASYSIYFFVWTVKYFPSPRANETLMLLSAVTTTFGTNNAAVIDTYISYLNSVYPLVTFAVMVACTAVIVYHLKKSSKFRSKPSKDGLRQLSTRERKINKMLIIIIIFYIMYLVPWLVYHFVITNETMPFSVGFLGEFFVPFTDFFSLVNASVNLYIFYFMSSEFKRTFRQMFRLPVDMTA